MHAIRSYSTPPSPARTQSSTPSARAGPFSPPPSKQMSPAISLPPCAATTFAVSSLGVGDSIANINLLFRLLIPLFFRGAMPDKEGMEAQPSLQRTRLDHRPPCRPHRRPSIRHRAHHHAGVSLPRTPYIPRRRRRFHPPAPQRSARHQQDRRHRHKIELRFSSQRTLNI
jgi:hypothetical protein